METADHRTVSFAILVGLIDKISRYKNNCKSDLNHSLRGEKYPLSRGCKETRIRKARHRNLSSIPGVVTDLSASQTVQIGYVPTRDISPEVKGRKSLDNKTPQCSPEVYALMTCCLTEHRDNFILICTHDDLRFRIIRLCNGLT
jgi:hypothetical protein